MVRHLVVLHIWWTCPLVKTFCTAVSPQHIEAEGCRNSSGDNKEIVGLFCPSSLPCMMVIMCEELFDLVSSST